MRTVVLYGFVMVCVTAVSFLVVTPVERKILNPDGITALSAPTKPAQVEVTNFPPVQAVSGTMNVGNLPLDTDGRLLVASPAAPALRFAGYTSATFADGTGLLRLNRACVAEFPSTRVCGAFEIAQLIPPPAPSPTAAFLVSFSGTRDQGGGGSIVGPATSCMSSDGVPFACGGDPMPVACCGF